MKVKSKGKSPQSQSCCLSVPVADPAIESMLPTSLRMLLLVDASSTSAFHQLHERAPVHVAAAKEEDVAVVRHHAVHQPRCVQPRALRLRLTQDQTNWMLVANCANIWWQLLPGGGRRSLALPRPFMRIAPPPGDAGWTPGHAAMKSPMQEGLSVTSLPASYAAGTTESTYKATGDPQTALRVTDRLSCCRTQYHKHSFESCRCLHAGAPRRAR